MQAPTDQRGGEETRRRLVASALEVFTERGYHAATLSEIAARAGLTTGAVYSTVGSKKALLVAVCSEAPADAGVDAALGGATSLHEALRNFVVAYARSGLTPTTLRMVQLQVEALKLMLSEPELAGAVVQAGRRQLADLAGRLDELARNDGVELPMVTRDLSILLSAMLNGLGLIKLIDASLVPDQLFLRGLHALMGWEQPADDGGGNDLTR